MPANRLRNQCSRAWRRALLVVLALTALGLNVGRAQAQTAPILKMGVYMPVMRDVTRKDVELTLRFWLDELARSGNIDIVPVKVYDDMATLKRDVDAGEVNFMVATMIGFAQYFKDDELANGVTGFKSLSDNLLLVVRRDAGFRTMADLAGKRLLLLEGDELSDIYMETYMMKLWGKPDWRRFGQISREKRSDKEVYRLFFNQSDAALIYRSGYETAAEMNPQIGKTLQILEPYSFSSRSSSNAFFSSKVPLSLRERFINAALKLNHTARGRQVLQIYQADVLEVSDKADLKPYRDLLVTHATLKAAAAPVGKKRNQ